MVIIIIIIILSFDCTDYILSLIIILKHNKISVYLKISIIYVHTMCNVCDFDVDKFVVFFVFFFSLLRFAITSRGKLSFSPL